MSFAYNLKLARKRCGYTQTDMSKKLHIDRTTYTKWESSISTKSIEITEFKIIKDNTLKDVCFFDTNEYTYTTADNTVYNNVRVDILGEIKDDSITSIEVQNNTPKKLIITENKNFDLRSFFIVTTYEYTFV